MKTFRTHSNNNVSADTLQNFAAADDEAVGVSAAL
jgi:hypothetical protein